MSTRHTRIDHDHEALTIEAYRRLNLRRPYTDGAIGSTTASKRSADAQCSALHTDDSPIRAGWTRRGSSGAARATQTAMGHHETPETADGHTARPDVTHVPRTEETT